MPKREPGFPGTTPNGEGEAYTKIAIHEVFLFRFHEEPREDAHFDPESDRPARRRAVVETQYAETVADSHLRLDVTPVVSDSVVSDSGALRIHERGPDLYLAWGGEEGLKGLDFREPPGRHLLPRSEEHTSELSHGEISYAVFCLKKKNTRHHCRLIQH